MTLCLRRLVGLGLVGVLMACASPETSTGKGAQTGAWLGGMAAYVLGGDTEDVVRASVAGGLTGAAIGGATESERQAKQSNALAEERVRLERERLEMDKQRAGVATAPASGDDNWMNDPAMLERAFGADTVKGLYALRDCKYQTAAISATAAKASSNAMHQLAATWLEAMLAVEQNKSDAAAGIYKELVTIDPEINDPEQANKATLDLLADLRLERKAKGISCS